MLKEPAVVTERKQVREIRLVAQLAGHRIHQFTVASRNGKRVGVRALVQYRVGQCQV